MHHPAADPSNDAPLRGMTVLVVEDEPAAAREALAEIASLGASGLRAETVKGARALYADNDIDLIVLDRMLADSEDGLALLSWFKELEAPAPGVLVASRLSTADDHIRGLDLGADDYIDKPFDMRELAARLKALARRVDATRSPKTVLIWGDLELRTLNGRALWKGEAIELRPQAFKLLHALALHKGEYISREALWRAVWPEYKNLNVQDPVINTAINRLRKSMSGIENGPQILSENLGYRLRLKE
jgi:DNA-binding response OmpR family regulator